MRIPIGVKGRGGAGKFARSNKSGICDFCYSFDGTVGGNNYSYRIYKKDGPVVFTYERAEYTDTKKTETAISEKVLKRIYSAYLHYRLAEWNGFSKYNKYMCDGEGFSLSIKFNDGKDFYAHGMNAFPDRYREFCAEMEEIFRDLKR